MLKCEAEGNEKLKKSLQILFLSRVILPKHFAVLQDGVRNRGQKDVSIAVSLDRYFCIYLVFVICMTGIPTRWSPTRRLTGLNES